MAMQRNLSLWVDVKLLAVCPREREKKNPLFAFSCDSRKKKKKKKKNQDSQLSLINNTDMLALCSSCGSDNCTTVSFGQCTKYGSAGSLMAAPVRYVDSEAGAGEAVPSMGVYLIGSNQTCDAAVAANTPIQLLFRTCFHQAGGSLLFSKVDLKSEMISLCVFDKFSGSAHDRCESHLLEPDQGAPVCYDLSFSATSCALQADEVPFAVRPASNPSVETIGIIGILLLSVCILAVMIVVVVCYKRNQRRHVELVDQSSDI
jgi:hypothetical protein